MEINKNYARNALGRGVVDQSSFLTKQLDFLKKINCLKHIQAAALFVVGGLMLVYLYLWKKIKNRSISGFHKDAIKRTDLFLEQYPFGIYGILAKSFELTYLENVINELPKKINFPILEVAIGEGSLSRRLFKKRNSVVGLDINPGSLVHTTNMKHVRRSIICDCINLPIQKNSYKLLVANNFLHHVTDKNKVLKKFSKVAKFSIFNENSPFWSSCQTQPLFLRMIGLKKEADQYTKKLCNKYWQDLWPIEKIQKTIERYFLIQSKQSYFNKNTFAMAFIFSFIYRGTAPVEPEIKSLLLHRRFRSLALFMSRKIAELLIYFDYFQDRKKDVFISYFVSSKTFRRLICGTGLLCPNCGNGKVSWVGQCKKCKRKYKTVNKMLFLIPKTNERILDIYQQSRYVKTRAEHL